MASFFESFAQALPTGIRLGQQAQQLQIQRESLDLRKEELELKRNKQVRIQRFFESVGQITEDERAILQDRAGGAQIVKGIIDLSRLPKNLRKENLEVLLPGLEEAMGAPVAVNLRGMLEKATPEQLQSMASAVSSDFAQNEDLGLRDMMQILSDPQAALDFVLSKDIGAVPIPEGQVRGQPLRRGPVQRGTRLAQSRVDRLRNRIGKLNAIPAVDSETIAAKNSMLTQATNQLKLAEKDLKRSFTASLPALVEEGDIDAIRQMQAELINLGDAPLATAIGGLAENFQEIAQDREAERRSVFFVQQLQEIVEGDLPAQEKRNSIRQLAATAASFEGGGALASVFSKAADDVIPDIELTGEQRFMREFLGGAESFAELASDIGVPESEVLRRFRESSQDNEASIKFRQSLLSAQAKLRADKQFKLRPLSELQAFTKGRQSLRLLNQIRSVRGKVPIGRLTGKRLAIKEFLGFGLKPEEARLLSAVRQLEKQVIAALRGAQVGVAEEARFLPILPQLNQTETLFFQNVQNIEDSLKPLNAILEARLTGDDAKIVQALDAFDAFLTERTGVPTPPAMTLDEATNQVLGQ